MRTLNCGCRISENIEKLLIHCPKCRRFLPNLFLGEPFPDVYSSPLRELLRKIYSLDSVAGNFLDIGGNQLVRGIFNAIDKAQFCFFDVTGDTFNVAYEMGYAVSNFQNPDEKKFIVAGASDDLANHVLSQTKMRIIEVLPQKPDITRKVKKYQILENIAEIDERSGIQYCDRNIREIFSIESPFSDEYILKQIEDFYPEEIPFPSKRPDKDVLVLTTEEFFPYFTNSANSNVTKFDFMSPHEPFKGVDEMKYLIKNICNKIIKKYDYLIVHLLHNKIDCVENSWNYNFKCGFIAGMMKWFKRNVQSTYYVVNARNTQKFSDISIYDKYNSEGDISRIVREILQKEIS